MGFMGTLRPWPLAIFSEVFFEVAGGPEVAGGGGGGTAQFAGAGFPVGSETVPGPGKEGVDKCTAADDDSVAEVANPMAEHLGEGDVAGTGEGFQLGLGLRWVDAFFEGFFLDLTVGRDDFTGFFLAFLKEEDAVGFGDAAGPVAGVGLGALFGHDGADKASAGFGAGAFADGSHGFAIAAPAVVGGVCDDAGTDWVEIDVGGDGAGGETVLDDDAFEGFLPEVSATVVLAVVPAGEALEEGFHEFAEVVHAVGVALMDALDAGFATGGVALRDDGAGFGEFPGDLGDGGFGVEGAKAFEEDLVGDAGGGLRRDFQQEVDVVAHDAVGEHAAAGEVLGHAHEGAEFLLVLLAEGEAAVDDARDAMVDGGLGLGISPRDDPSGFGHDGENRRMGAGRQG